MLNLSQKSQIKLYTDGAYSSSRDQGGIGIVILDGDKIIKEFSYAYKHVTNNKMEIAAVILGLRFITEKCESITIYTDSMYVIGQATKGWKRNKNIALLKELDRQINRVKKLCNSVTFEHVKGHSDNQINNKCDKLAVQASQSLLSDA